MIPDDIRRFIVQCIPSVPFLEALLLLRESRQRDWDGAELATRLYLDTAAAADLLERLARTGLLARDASDPSRYRYAPRTARLADMASELAVVYSQNLVEVSTLIHSKSNRTAHVFADAFVLRRKKEEEN
jgi:DNA-binding IclR family transcriptional regulator